MCVFLRATVRMCACVGACVGACVRMSARVCACVGACVSRCSKVPTVTRVLAYQLSCTRHE